MVDSTPMPSPWEPVPVVDRRKTVLRVKTSATEHRRIEEAAKKSGMATDEWSRRWLVEHAQRELTPVPEDDDDLTITQGLVLGFLLCRCRNNQPIGNEEIQNRFRFCTETKNEILRVLIDKGFLFGTTRNFVLTDKSRNLA